MASTTTSTTTNSLPDFLQGVVDRGLGIFDKVVDFEFGKRELDVAKDVFAFKQAQAFEADQRAAAFSSSAGTGFGSGSTLGGVSVNTLLLIGAALVGVVLLARR